MIQVTYAVLCRLLFIYYHGFREGMSINKTSLIFSYFSMKTYVVRILGEALLMSTHNICFCGEIRKLSGCSLLSGYMNMLWAKQQEKKNTVTRCMTNVIWYRGTIY